MNRGSNAQFFSFFLFYGSTWHQFGYDLNDDTRPGQAKDCPILNKNDDAVGSNHAKVRRG